MNAARRPWSLEPLRVTCLFLVGLAAANVDASAQNVGPSDVLRDWLAQAQAAGATVKVGSTETSSDGAVVRASNIVIETSTPAGQLTNIKIALGQLTLTSASETASAFRVGRVHIDKLQIASGGASFSATAVDLKDLGLPRSLKTDMDPQHPTASLVRFAHNVFATHVGEMILSGLSLASPGAISALGVLSAENISDGEIATLHLKDFHFQSGAPKSEARIGELSLNQVSLGTLVAIIDPQTYRVAVLERTWKTIVGHAEFTSLDMQSINGHTVVQQINLGPLEGRRLESDPTPILDIAAVSPMKLKEQPALAARLSDGIASAVRVVKASIHGYVSDDGAEPISRRAQADTIDVVELAPKTIKEVTVSPVQILLGDAGMRVASVKATNLELAATPSLAANTPGISLPKFGSILIDQIIAVRPGVNASLGTVKVEASDYVGQVPTHLEASIEGVAFPVADLPNNAFKVNLADLKIEKLQLNASFAAQWQEAAEQFDISTAQIEVAGLGTLSATASLAGVGRTALEHPETAADTAATVGIKQARINFRDSGLTTRVLAKFAEENKLPIDKIRAALTSNMPTLLGAINDAASRNRLIFAAVSFLNDPKSISIFTTLDRPSPLMKAIEAWRTSPQLLPGLLKLDATANRPS